MIELADIPWLADAAVNINATTTLIASGFAFLGILVTAVFTYLGTRNRGEPLSPTTPPPGQSPALAGDLKLRHNYDMLMDSLRLHREMLIQHDITPPPYPELEP